MPRKPKTAATSPAPAGGGSGIAGTFPETLTGLQVAISLLTDLTADALKEAAAAGVVPEDVDKPAGQMLGWITAASNCLIRAAGAGGLVPEEALKELEEVMAEDAPT